MRGAAGGNVIDCDSRDGSWATTEGAVTRPGRLVLDALRLRRPACRGAGVAEGLRAISKRRPTCLVPVLRASPRSFPASCRR